MGQPKGDNAYGCRVVVVPEEELLTLLYTIPNKLGRGRATESFVTNSKLYGDVGPTIIGKRLVK